MGLEILLARARLAQAISSATLADDRVYRSRVLPLEPSLLPAVLVYAGDEPAEEYNARPASYRRTARLWVEIVGRFRPEFDDVLEVIRAQVEAVVAVDITLGGSVLECDLVVIQRPPPAKEGKYTLAAVRVGFDAVYVTESTDPATLTDLNLLLAQWDLAIPDDVLEATDEIDLS